MSIREDDSSLVFSETTLSVPEGGTAEYTVALATEPSAAVTVAIGGVSGDLAGALPAHGLTSRTWCGRGYLLGASAGGRENVCLTIPRGAACGRCRFRPCRARRPESRGEVWTVTGGKVVDAGRRKRLWLTSTERQASIKPAPEPKHVEFRAQSGVQRLDVGSYAFNLRLKVGLVPLH